MNKIVDLYLARKDIPTKMDVVQCSQDPAITFVLKDYQLQTGATARIFIKKSNAEVYNTCTVSGNTITYQPTVTSFDEVGTFKAQLEIVNNGKIAVTFLLYVKVEPNIIDGGAIEAQDDFSALQDAILAVGDISSYKAQTTQNKNNITAILNKTNKMAIQNSVSNITFGSGQTMTNFRIWGNSENKIGIDVGNNQDNKNWYLLVKGDAMTLYDGTNGAEVYRLPGYFQRGTHVVDHLFAPGYSTDAPGRYYFFPQTFYNMPFGNVMTASNVKVTEATIRGSGLVIADADLTSYVTSMERQTNGKPRLIFEGLTENFVASASCILVCTLEFTLS